VEGVRQRPADLRQQLDLRRHERRLAALGAARPAGCPDDVAEREVELLLDDQLDPPGAVDEVEKGELPHLAARQHASRDAELVVTRLARLGLLRRGPDRGDLRPVWEPLRQHRAADSKRP
jgi:hypothetical protein